ncbi:MAG TPA: hypothetical protein VLG11_01690 [Candidatus Saccharimonadales bacterium]|nr:hypothetical protein [Candidatus Saccharimonadales bacterium]
MTIWWLVLVVGYLVASAAGFIWLLLHVGRGTARGNNNGLTATDSLRQAAREDVEHIFNNEFREELRNRGRLHFEKIIGENAMFLQQDLRLTTSQMNEFMKQEITRSLEEAFKNYQSAVGDAKQMAIDSLEKTKTTVDEQRKVLTLQLETEFNKEKEQRLKRFDEKMGDIVNHYIQLAIGNQIDLSDQLEYILSQLEKNKQAILEDVKNGA